jgi:AraC-like DNA-binding protein
MQIITDPSILAEDYWKFNSAGKKSVFLSSKHLSERDQKYVQAPPICFNFMLYCNIVNQFRLLHKHRGWMIQPDFLSLRFIVEGSEFVRYDGKTFLTEPGDLMIFHPFHDYEYAPGPEGFCFQRSITMKGTLLQTILEYSNLSSQFCINLETPSFFLDAHTSLMKILQSKNLSDYTQNAAICFQVLQHLSDICKASRIPDKLSEIQHFIEQHLGDDLRLNKLSSKFNSCPSTINQLFRAHLNVSVHRYIINRRMDKALNMHRSHNYSIKETAALLGFSSQFNFSTEFKKKYGKSPRIFFQK